MSHLGNMSRSVTADGQQYTRRYTQETCYFIYYVNPFSITITISITALKKRRQKKKNIHVYTYISFNCAHDQKLITSPYTPHVVILNYSVKRLLHFHFHLQRIFYTHCWSYTNVPCIFSCNWFTSIWMRTHWNISYHFQM